jgi:hypothetical protein
MQDHKTFSMDDSSDLQLSWERPPREFDQCNNLPLFQSGDYRTADYEDDQVQDYLSRRDSELPLISTAKEDGNTGEFEHLQSNVLSARGTTPNYEYADDRTQISNVLASECSFMYAKGKSIVYKEEGPLVKCYIYDSTKPVLNGLSTTKPPVLNGLFTYDKYWLDYKDCLSSSGQTLAVIPVKGVLEIWKLSAQQGQRARIEIPRGVQKKILLVSCDDRNVAYYTESQYLTIIDIAEEAAQTKADDVKGCYELPCECELLQVFNGSLYYGSKKKLYVSSLSELNECDLDELKLPRSTREM